MMQPHRCMHWASNGRIRFFNFRMRQHRVAATIISFLSECSRNHSKFQTNSTNILICQLFLLGGCHGSGNKSYLFVHIVVAYSNAFIFVMVAYGCTQRFRYSGSFFPERKTFIKERERMELECIWMPWLHVSAVVACTQHTSTLLPWLDGGQHFAETVLRKIRRSEKKQDFERVTCVT